MGTAHFVTASIGAGVVTLCGKTFTSQEKERMGIFGMICPDCDQRMKAAWVTFK